jgi:hypothetical protein
MSGHPVSWKIIMIRVVSAILIVFGLGAGYFWFYHLGPMRRLADPNWYRYRSNAGLWEECQRCMNRFDRIHEAGRFIGQFGGKPWFERVVDNLQPGEEFGCGSGHKETALRMMTNQDAGDAAAWLVWWEQNKSKSQEDWIRDGFRKYKVDIHTPLTPSNIISLLKITAYTDDDKCGVPDYVQYNAFRWLRDSDFDPKTFSIKDIPSKDGNEVLHGLVRFAYWSGVIPKRDGLGVFKLGDPVDIEANCPMPQSATLGFKITANAIVFVPLCIGSLLLWLSFRRRVPAQAP